MTKTLRYTASVEPAEGGWKITVHTTQNYYVVQNFYKGVRQENYRTTQFDKAMRVLKELVVEADKR